MSRRLEIIILALFALGAAAVGGGVTSSRADEAGIEVDVGDLRGEILSLFAPLGEIATETNPNYKGAPTSVPAAPPSPSAADWPSYNKTLTSERFSDLSQINTKNVARLKVLCTYDTWRLTAFETGLIMVEGSLIGTTEFDIFSINPSTCAENWRSHEEYPAYILPTNRGAAYIDGMLFRGTDDGRVLAYDFKTGRRLWETRIADPSKGESVPAAPIAWQGLVFIGNAGGDFKGGKGRVYALDAKTGKIVWEFYLVPKVEGDPVRGPEGASPLDTSTWKNIPGAPISGGGTWTSTTLDPASGLLYVPVGNPAPDFDNSVRQGDNLFTGSVVVLDAKTGAYKNHFQLGARPDSVWTG
jgi:alcohol dehydrogenase (cytochrome c)